MEKEITIGSKVEILTTESLNKTELQLLKNLDFICTVEDLDIVRKKVLGVYVKELPGYLLTVNKIKLV